MAEFQSQLLRHRGPNVPNLYQCWSWKCHDDSGKHTHIQNLTLLKENRWQTSRQSHLNAGQGRTYFSCLLCVIFPLMKCMKNKAQIPVKASFPPVAVRRVSQRVEGLPVLKARPRGVSENTVSGAPGPRLHARRTAAFAGPHRR